MKKVLTAASPVKRLRLPALRPVTTVLSRNRSRICAYGTRYVYCLPSTSIARMAKRGSQAELEALRKRQSEAEMKAARTIHDLNKEIGELDDTLVVVTADHGHGCECFRLPQR